MTREEIVQLAEKAGASASAHSFVVGWADIERFAHLVAAAEREACAQICEEEKALRLAEIIRARGEHMTDRELLEAAAEAAGVKALRCPNGVLRDCTGLDPAMNIFSAPEWNPLDDDGEALRLAVKLHLRVMPQERCTYVETNPDSLLAFPNVSELEVNGSDPYAATRRAIVRAAAEIGRLEK